MGFLWFPGPFKTKQRQRSKMSWVPENNVRRVVRYSGVAAPKWDGRHSFHCLSPKKSSILVHCQMFGLWKCGTPPQIFELDFRNHWGLERCWTLLVDPCTDDHWSKAPCCRVLKYSAAYDAMPVIVSSHVMQHVLVLAAWQLMDKFGFTPDN